MSILMQVSRRNAMQAALDANRALQSQLQLVKEQIEKFLLENSIQATSVKQLRTNPSMFSCGPLLMHVAPACISHNTHICRAILHELCLVDAFACLTWYTLLSTATYT